VRNNFALGFSGLDDCFLDTCLSLKHVGVSYTIDYFSDGGPGNQSHFVTLACVTCISGADSSLVS